MERLCAYLLAVLSIPEDCKAHFSADEAWHDLGRGHWFTDWSHLPHEGLSNKEHTMCKHTSYLVSFRAQGKTHMPSLVSDSEEPCSDRREIVLFSHS